MARSANVAENVPEVFNQLLEKMVDEDSSLISIYYGQDTSKEDAESLAATVQETYPNAKLICILEDSRFISILFQLNKSS